MTRCSAPQMKVEVSCLITTSRDQICAGNTGERKSWRFLLSSTESRPTFWSYHVKKGPHHPKLRALQAPLRKMNHQSLKKNKTLLSHQGRPRQLNKHPPPRGTSSSGSLAFRLWLMTLILQVKPTPSPPLCLALD